MTIRSLHFGLLLEAIGRQMLIRHTIAVYIQTSTFDTVWLIKGMYQIYDAIVFITCNSYRKIRRKYQNRKKACSEGNNYDQDMFP